MRLVSVGNKASQRSIHIYHNTWSSCSLYLYLSTPSLCIQNHWKEKNHPLWERGFIMRSRNWELLSLLTCTFNTFQFQIPKEEEKGSSLITKRINFTTQLSTPAPTSLHHERLTAPGRSPSTVAAATTNSRRHRCGNYPVTASQ